MTAATALDRRPGSRATARATEVVAERTPIAAALGRSLAGDIHDPEALAARLRRGLTSLADPAYLEGQRRVAPGIGSLHGVRSPLLTTVATELARATRGVGPAPILFVADRLLREPALEAHWLAFGLLERTLPDDPERTWQLIRRAAREAGDWITVDTLARPVAAGVLAEPYRWAELEQLVFSPSSWERRLVGSAIATLPFVDRVRGREPEIATRGLDLLGRLIGDAEPDVQKALAWAYRSLIRVDPDAVAAALDREASRAADTADGHRAWVVRDALPKLPPATAEPIRPRLAGIRRRPGAPSTSEAAELAARFGALPDPRNLPEPPLT